MKRRYKILGTLTLFGLSGLAALALTLRYESACPPGPAATSEQSITAVTARCYGSPEVLQLERLARPELGADRVLVRVLAAAVNPLDWHQMRGKPYVMRLGSGIGKPDDFRVGVDFAGVVEAVGDQVQRFKPGDAVFGARNGSLAEYLSVAEDGLIVHKPDNVSFAQAGAVAVAGTTALQALRDHGQLQAGERVLINGASGGVGTFAVQIAKALGAEVTAVCSGRNAAMVQAIGADHVIDYKRQSYPEMDQRYDLIVDMIGNHSLSANQGVLTSAGRMVLVGSKSDEEYLGPVWNALWAAISGPFREHQIGMMLAELRVADLQTIADWMRSGQVAAVIDREYPLPEVVAAMTYLEAGRARGKVVVTME